MANRCAGAEEHFGAEQEQIDGLARAAASAQQNSSSWYASTLLACSRWLLTCCAQMHPKPYQMHWCLTQCQSPKACWVYWNCGSLNSPVTRLAIESVNGTQLAARTRPYRHLTRQLHAQSCCYAPIRSFVTVICCPEERWLVMSPDSVSSGQLVCQSGLTGDQ